MVLTNVCGFILEKASDMAAQEGPISYVVLKDLMLATNIQLQICLDRVTLMLHALGPVAHCQYA